MMTTSSSVGGASETSARAGLTNPAYDEPAHVAR